MNPQGLRAMYAQIGQRIKVVDGQLRAAHSGKPTIEIEPLAKAALAATAVTLRGLRGNRAKVAKNSATNVG